MRLSSSNVQNKSLEIERKYSLDPKKWDEFVKRMRSFGPEKELIAEGPDTYYQNDSVVLRWRISDDLSQFTIKSRYSLRSSIVRQEIEIDLNDNTARGTIEFIKSLGFKKLFRIHKKCHIFWITNALGEACIVVYRVKSKNYNDRYFLEIEAKKGMSVHDSKKLINFWEKSLNISITRRLNETLFEIYSGQVTKLINKEEKVLCFKCGIEKTPSNFDNCWLEKSGSKCKECRQKETGSVERREWSKNYNANKFKNDLEFKIKILLRNRANNAIKSQKTKKMGSFVKDMGCTVLHLKKYLESLFYSNKSTGEEMSWSNRGWGPGKWQLDHKESLGLFDLSKRKEFLMACHYTNMQPLWWEDHMLKTKKDNIKIKIKRKTK